MSTSMMVVLFLGVFFVLASLYFLRTSIDRFQEWQKKNQLKAAAVISCAVIGVIALFAFVDPSFDRLLKCFPEYGAQCFGKSIHA